MKKIYLGGEKGRGMYTLVDDAYYDELSKHAWNISVNGYAVATIYYDQVKMHRLVTGAKKGDIVDHINGNSLDNRRSNLRFCTNAENSINSRISKSNKSGYKGVFWHKYHKRWASKIVVDQRAKWLGYFDRREEAAEAYNQAATKYFGEFARLNVIPASAEASITSS